MSVEHLPKLLCRVVLQLCSTAINTWGQRTDTMASLGSQRNAPGKVTSSVFSNIHCADSFLVHLIAYVRPSNLLALRSTLMFPLLKFAELA